MDIYYGLWANNIHPFWLGLCILTQWSRDVRGVSGYSGRGNRGVRWLWHRSLSTDKGTSGRALSRPFPWSTWSSSLFSCPASLDNFPDLGFSIYGEFFDSLLTHLCFLCFTFFFFGSSSLELVSLVCNLTLLLCLLQLFLNVWIIHAFITKAVNFVI